ncbi:hypothetical protein DPEC_G00163890, partial [Dallia pectoralis]
TRSCTDNSLYSPRIATFAGTPQSCLTPAEAPGNLAQHLSQKTIHNRLGFVADITPYIFPRMLSFNLETWMGFWAFLPTNEPGQ